MLSTLYTAALAAQQQCDLSKPAAHVCDSFCNYQCSFFNTSLGETGAPSNITLYRLTPKNVTGIQNKDTGDAPGDISFLLSRKNLTQECALDPKGWGCFLDGDNLYGKFTVEFDGNYGPYFECNPIAVYEEASTLRDPITEWGVSSWPSPKWSDTRDFECGQGCMQPTRIDGHASCNEYEAPRNGTYGFGGAYQCFCDGTGRHNKTIGREAPPYAGLPAPGPSTWVPQCRLAYEQVYEFWKPSRCVKGTPLRQVSGWSFESVTAIACDACSADSACTGWRTDDNKTATLLTGHISASSDDCIGGKKHYSHHGGAGTNWGSAGDLGGFWYSTPITAECKHGAPLGTDGCAWRVVEETYRNASCVDGLVDAAVEAYGAACFATCTQPLNRTATDYLNCYKNTLLGDAAFNLTAMPQKQIVEKWSAGFGDGGCPVVQPAKCEGEQCGDGGGVGRAAAA